MNKKQMDFDFYKSIFLSSVEGILVVSMDGIILNINPAGERMFGYSTHELMQKKVETLIPNAFKKNHEIHRTKYSKNPKARRMGQNMDLWGLKKDGTHFPLEISLSPTTIGKKQVIIAFIIDITDRITTKQALLISKNRMAEAQHLASVGNWYWSFQNNERYWSDEFYRILGLAPGDKNLNADTAIDFIHPDDRKNAQDALKYAINNKTPYNFEKRIIRPNGTVRHTLAKGKTIYNKQGKPLEMFGTIQDITENKTMRTALGESNRKFSTLIDNLQGIVYRCKNDRDWTMEYISEGCKLITGYTSHEFLTGKVHFSHITFQEDQDAVWNATQKAIDEKKAFRLTYRIKDKKGRVKYLSELGQGVYDSKGNLEALEGFIADITEQNRIERELKVSKEQIEEYTKKLEKKITERTKELTSTVEKLLKSNISLEDQIQETQIVHNIAQESKTLLSLIAKNFPKGLIVVFNDNFSIDFIEGEELDRKGFRETITEGIKLADIKGLQENQKLSLKKHIEETLDGEHLSFELDFEGSSYLVNTTPIYNQEKKVTQALMVYNNISIQKQTELKILSTLKKEQQLSELKSRFISIASHEFRTPLSAILSSAILIEKLNAPEKEDRRLSHVSKIRSNVNNLVMILNDFLSHSKLEEGKVFPQPISFDLIDYLKSLIEEMEGIKRSRQKIIFNHPKSNTMVFLDPKLLKHIVFNLLTNAIKYSGENTAINFNIEIKDQRLLIELKDQGIGIPVDDQNNLFQRFYRATNASGIQGTGLGLNIVKQYTELMGGTVDFKSELNKGSTFYVVIPLNNQRNEKNIIN